MAKNESFNSCLAKAKPGKVLSSGSTLQSELFPKFGFLCRHHLFCTLNKSKGNTFKSYHFNRFPINTIAQHAKVASKRFSSTCANIGLSRSPITRIACAVSLACTRYHIIPSALALVIGKIAWNDRVWADADHLPSKDSIYMRAQDGHLFLTSFVYSIFDGFILILRAIYLTILFSPSIAMAPFADRFGIQFRKMWLRTVHHTLEKAGPAFIKWGQWAATRPDLFPTDLCSELTKLHSKAPSHTFAYTKSTIEKAFGRKISDIFEDFEEEPVASGSIAQVHRASLKFRYSNKQKHHALVAVKVRHPGVGESIRRDFLIINVVAKLSNFVPALKWLRLDESVRQFAVFMMSQVDLAREAAHLSRFIYNFRRWKDVSFPKPLYPLVHPAVLVETYEHGESVSHFVDELEGNNRLKSALADIGTNALLKMLLVISYVIHIYFNHSKLLKISYSVNIVSTRCLCHRSTGIIC